MRQRAAYSDWLAVCSTEGMRIVVGFLIAAALIGGFVAHKQRQESPAPAPTVTTTAAPTAREHHWPKRAFDRVDDVKRQVAAERKSNDVP